MEKFGNPCARGQTVSCACVCQRTLCLCILGDDGGAGANH